MTFKTFGDSISTNATTSGASPASNSWMGLFSPENAAVSGNGAGDMSKIIQASTPDNAKQYAVMIGTNDVRQYKADTTKQDYYKQFLLASLVWLSCPTLKKARTSGTAIYTGTWSNTAGNAFGKVTTQSNAKVTETFSGDALYIGYILQNNTAADSQAEVRVDGVLVGTVGCYMNINTVGGNSYSGACTRFSGFGAGSHTVELTVTTSGKNFYYDFVAGSDDIDNAGIALSNVIQYGSAGYSTYGVTSAVIDQFNDIVDGLITDLSADGVTITLVDNHASIDNTTDLNTDGIHPNNAGHAKIHANFSSLL